MGRPLKRVLEQCGGGDVKRLPASKRKLQEFTHPRSEKKKSKLLETRVQCLPRV